MAKKKTENEPMKKTMNAGKINFIGLAKPFGILSLTLTLLSLAVIFVRGFNYGIDFAGGTEMQVQFGQEVESGKIRQMMNDIGIKDMSVQEFGSGNEFLLRFEVLQGKTDKETSRKNNELINRVTGQIKSGFAEASPNIRRVDSVGPQIGDELKRDGLLAIFYSLIMILIYVGLRFDFKYAASAVLCLFHDTVITLGIFSLLQKQVNVQIMAAVLTIIGYSINDTVVNFDRIRETVGLYRGEPLATIVNRAVNDMLSRTTLTSLTTLIAIAALYFLAGGVIKDFAFTLGIGVIIGTYSSIYVASPLVLVFDHWKSKA